MCPIRYIRTVMTNKKKQNAPKPKIKNNFLPRIVKHRLIIMNQNVSVLTTHTYTNLSVNVELVPL